MSLEKNEMENKQETNEFDFDLPEVKSEVKPKVKVYTGEGVCLACE